MNWLAFYVSSPRFGLELCDFECGRIALAPTALVVHKAEEIIIRIAGIDWYAGQVCDCHIPLGDYLQGDAELQRMNVIKRLSATQRARNAPLSQRHSAIIMP